MKINVEVDVPMTVATLAECFCSLNDDEQCKFFVEVARIASTWQIHAGMQWYALGGHLKNCKCSTDEARDMIETIAHALKHAQPHGQDRVALATL